MQSPSPIATASVHLPVRLDWLDRRREEIIEPDLPIVDPHHHLVDRPETGRYLLPELPRRSRQWTQHHRYRLPRMAVDVPRGRTGRDAPGR